MAPWARPSIALACVPTARTERLLACTATMDGSSTTIPGPGAQMRGLAVPRSAPRLFGKITARTLGSMTCSRLATPVPSSRGRDGIIVCDWRAQDVVSVLSFVAYMQKLHDE